MPEIWLNFTIVIFVQLILFIICAFYEIKLSDTPRILGFGALIGIIVGIPFDLLVGKFFGIHSYTFGFDTSFLIINSSVSYGLFVATILLLQHVRLQYFILWSILLMIIYETTNNFFNVWVWNFELSHIKFLSILMIGYLGGTILVAIISHKFIKRKFLFIDNFLKQK